MFSAPIPGQSLVSEPKNANWENPPEYPAPEDALLWHMDRLQKPEKMKAILQFIELGLDVTMITEGILRSAVADGQHTLDVSLIIAPVIHEYIVGLAEAAGLEYDDGFEDEELSDEQLAYSLNERAAEKILAEYEETDKIDLTPLEESMPMEEAPQEEPMQEEKPKGLMARRTA